MVHTTKNIKCNPYLTQKHINKEAKWPIESKNLHATTNNYISKSFPILGSYSSITVDALSYGSIYPLPLP